MAVLDTLKVVIEGDASGLQSAFTVATRVLQKLEAALDRLEASASKHTQATDRIAAAHTRMAATTKVAADKTAAVQARAERDFFKLAQAAERASAREAAAAARAASAIDRSIAKIHAAQERTKRDYDKAVAAAERAATREKAAAERAAGAVSRAADKKAVALAKAAAKQETASERSTASWAKEIAIFQRYRAALYLAGAAIQSVYKMAEDGARAGAAEAYFRNAGKSISEFRTATKGLISDAELMKKVNLADTMGLTGETFKTLANVAHASAAKTGQSFQHMLDSIILGTARESRLLLDNLGIIVNVTDAKKAFAKSLKEGADAAKYSSLTVDQLAASLTDAGEKAAFFAEVSRKGNKPILEQAQVGATAADNFDRFAAAVDNLKIAIGKLLAEGSGSAIAKLAAGIKAVADHMERINRVGMFKEGSVADSLKGQWDKLDFMKGGAVGAVMGNPLLAPVAAGAAIYGAYASGTQPQETERDLQLEFDVLTEKAHYAGIELEDVSGYLRTFQDLSLDDAINGAEQFGDGIYAVVAELKKTADKLGYVFPEKKSVIGPDFVDPDKLVPDTKAPLKKTHDDVWERYMAFVEKEIEDSWDRILLDQEAAAKAAAAAVHFPWEPLLKNLVTIASDALGTATPGDIDKALDKASREAFRQEKESQAAEGVDQAHGVVSSLISGSASGLGAAIGGFFGPLGTAIGSLIGELLDPLTPVIELLGHLASGIKTLLEVGLNPFLERLEPLGPALEMLLNAVGILVGSALRALIPYLDLLVTFTVYLIDVFVFLLAVLSPVVEALVVFTAGVLLIVGLLWNIISALSGGRLLTFADAMSFAAYRAGEFANKLAEITVFVHNGIISFVRSLGRALGDLDVFDLEHFGDKIQAADIMPPPDPTIEENTDATDDNTRAVEQLSRDLRNLPSGYKVNYTLYGATAPAGLLPNPRGNLAGALAGSAGRPPNFRWRT